MTQANFNARGFTKPERNDMVFTVGEKLRFEWFYFDKVTPFTMVAIALFQQDPPPAIAARVGRTLLETRSPVTGFTWAVSTEDHDAARSNKYFIWVWNTSYAPDIETINSPSGPKPISRFVSPYFFIKQPDSVSTNSTINNTTTATPPPISSSDNSSNTGGISGPQIAGIVVGVILLGSIGMFLPWWFWWRPRRSEKKQRGFAEMEAKSLTRESTLGGGLAGIGELAEMPEGHGAVEMPVMEKPVEIEARPAPAELQ